MRAAALAALLLTSAVPARADKIRSFRKQFHGRATAQGIEDVANTDRDGSLIKLMGLILAVPYAYSFSLDPQGYAPFPYSEGPRGDQGEKPWLNRLELFYHRVGDGVGGWGGRWRLDSEQHVGLEAAWTHYRERGDEDLHYVVGSAHGDIARDDNWRVDYQLGVAALAGRDTRIGPRLAVETEAFPGKPFLLDALAGVAFIDNGPLGELRAGAGVTIKHVQVRFGYRALIGPFKTLDGPDGGLTLRF